MKEHLQNIKIFTFLILSSLNLFLSYNSFGEGTKDIWTISSQPYYLHINRSGGLTVPFAMFTPNTFAYQAGTSSNDYRFNIHVCTPGEKVRFGFTAQQKKTYYRIKRQSDNAVVFGPMLMPTTSVGQAGYINSYAEAVAGPKTIVGASGYNDTGFVATEAGDYYVEINLGNGTTYNGTGYDAYVTYFDIAVVDASNAIRSGRIWSKAWQMIDANNAFSGNFYIYSDDSIVTRMAPNGLSPHAFSISCNATGCTKTGNAATDRMSRSGAYLYPQYKVFFNDPDNICYPSGFYGSIVGIPTVTGCGGVRCINLNVSKAGNIVLTLDLNGSPGFQVGTKDRQISAAVVKGNNCVPWDGLDGQGNPVAPGFSFTLKVDFLNGITHLPLYDAEDNPNGYKITQVRPASATPPKVYWDDSNIIPTNYPSSTAIDGISNYSGCVTATGCHRWKSRGDNSCPPCSETANSWWYAKVDSVKVVYVNNTVVVDANTLTLGTGYAKNNFNSCGTSTPISLHGSVAGPATTTGLWTAPGGDGLFSGAASMTSTYTPGTNDIANGFVKIKLTSTTIGSSGCPPFSDSMLITLVKPPSVFAGITKSVCKNNPTVNLADATKNAFTTSVAWSGGTGIYVSSANVLNPTYTPSATELLGSSKVLTLKGFGDTLCTNATSTVTINFTSAPTVTAGGNASVCASIPNVTNITGTASASGVLKWTSSSGCASCISAPSSLVTNYNPSATDIGNGSVTLTLSDSMPGCLVVKSTMTITIAPSPTANAGVNQSKCKNNTLVTLAGTVTNATSQAWTSSSGCVTCFSSTTSLTPTYTPSATDLSNNSVTLTLKASKSGCTDAISTMTVSFTTAPTVDAGPATKQFCADKPSVQLAGVVTGSTGAQWSGGIGSYVTNNTDLNAVYSLDPIEVTIGIVKLYLTTTGNGTCNAVKDSITLTKNPIPIPNAGPTKSVCYNNATVTLTGASIVGAHGPISWSSATSGIGGFVDPTLLNPTYNLNATDLVNGSVSLTMSVSNATGPACAAQTSSMIVTVTPAPVVSAGADRSVCLNNPTITLNGASSTGTGTWSVFSGSGTVANPIQLNSTFTAASVGTTTLILTSSSNANCNAVKDTMVITTTPSPTSSPVTPASVCANNPVVNITGTTSTGTGTWSGAGSFGSANSNLTNTYTPTAGQITLGSATIKLTTTGNGNCNPVSTNIIVTITPIPTANAGPDQPVCASSPVANLSGTFTVATGVTWSGGSGTFSNNNIANPTYTLTAAEILLGSVTLTMTTTGNGNCNSVSDQIVISVTKNPTVNAGSDQVLCGSTASATLTGSVTVATGGNWTTTGTGTFASASSLNTSYTPSATDKTNGLVTLTLTSTGNGVCPAATDQMDISFTVVPTVNAGPNQTVCSNDFPVLLNGSGSPSTWVGGLGTFSSRANMSATYIPNVAEVLLGSVTLTLKTNASGACPQITDNVKITLLPGPIVTPGVDISICGNQNSITLAGSVTNALGGLWSTNGTGSFVNPGLLAAVYIPSPADKINGSITLTLNTTGNATCSPGLASITLTIFPTVTANAGPDQTLCKDGNNIPLSGSVSGATGGTWSKITGGGTINNPTNLATASYTPVAGDNSVTLRLTTSGSPAGCPSQTDDVIFTLSPAPTANANSDQTVCGDVASVTLNGAVTTATGGKWTTTGAGTFTLNNTTLNAKYIPAVNETGALTFTLTTTGNGTCAGVYSDQMILTITPKPTASAGTDRTVCANKDTVALTGIVTAATGGTWTSSGDGVFQNISGGGLIANYIPGTNDKTNGSVNLTLKTTGMGTCNAVSDVMVVNITPSPKVNAGPDRIVCANNSKVALLGTITVATGGVWSTLGTGNFTGVSANGLTATYNPSPADTVAHVINLVLTSSGNGTCNIVTDTVKVTITPKPTVIAGPSQVICADSFYVKLNAMHTIATAGIWSTTGTGSFFNSNATFDTATYVPSPADRLSGLVTLKYTTTVQGACSPVSDQLTVTITTAPTVNAGADQTICETTSSISILGTSNGVATGTIWTRSGDGVFGTPGSLGSTYAPGTADKAAGTVIITLTTTGNGTCKPASDQLVLKILNKPVVDAGPDLTVCADIMTTGKLLAPTVTNYSSVQWSTSGTGVFGPNANTMAAKYYPSLADTAAHSVILTLTANGNSPCTSQSDNLTFIIKPIPIIDAGADINVCNGSNASLNGKVRNAVGGSWSSSGTGTFAPSVNALNATYIPSPADTTSGSVTLTLTSTGIGTCNVVTDNMIITFRKKPTAMAGAARSVCADATSIMLNGTVTDATGGIWSSSGTGHFSPDNVSLNTMYFLTSADSANGSLVLTLTTTGMGSCAAATSNMNITITPIPTADAGPPSLSACKSAGTVALHGSVTNAGGGYWATQGDGSFDDATLLDPIYTFGVNDKLTNTMLLTFISQDNGACQFYTDSIRINLLLTTTVSAGPNRTICRADLPIHLQGSGANGTWSGGTPAGFSNANSLTSTYTPTVAEAGGPSLMLTLTPTGSCGGSPSNVTFTFMNSPTVHITPQGDTCTNVSTVNLKGSASAAGLWTTTGSGGFTDNTNINTAYTVSSGDRTAGVIKFVYTIPASGFCNAVLDSIRFKIAPTPTVNSGPDQSRCANALTAVNMNGAFSIASSVQWTKITNPGLGSITGSTTVNAVYNMDASDAAFPVLQFKLVTVGNGNCPAQSDTMNVVISASPTVAIGPDSTVCADKKVPLNAAITVATGGAWSSSGTGTFSPSAVVLNPKYTPSSSDTSSHTPVTLTFITTGNGICSAVSKTKMITFTPKPLVFAGADNTICSGQDSTALAPTSKANTPTILWTTTGTGTFYPNTTTLNAYYKPSATDKANGGAIIRLASTGVVECDSVFDYKTLIIIPSPVASVNAGFDQTICRDQGQAQLAGFILIATGAKWDCQGIPCTGQFSPNDQNLNALYIPSNTDTSAGNVVLRLTTTTGNGICAPVYDEMKLKIIDIPHVKAGTPQTVCADTSGITLNGSIYHATLVPAGYSWVASGTGVFTPNSYVNNPTYIPSSQDIINGAVGFTLTSTNNGTCQPYSNAVTATITAKPTINAGIDKATCANVSNVNLAGTITVATKGIWKSAGTGTFSSTSANGLVTKYAPSLKDDSAGVVYLNITTDPTTTGSCKSVTDQMMLTINPSPIVNAGIDQSICADATGISLNGTVLNATGGLWKSLGTGTFSPGASALTGTYAPSSSDTTAHSVQLILVSTGNGLCNSEDDTVTLSITPMPIVNAGSASICFATAGSLLNGKVIHAAGGQWSTSGTGVFSVNPFTLNATYYPSTADVSAGNITLTLSSTGNGTCNAVSNSTNLSITPIPLADAGGDQFICRGSSTIVAAATASNIAKYEWKRFSGLVISNSPTLNVTAVTDTAFILTVYDNKNCSSLSDTINVRVFDMPTAITLTGTSCSTDSNVVTATPIPAGLPPVAGVFQWFDNGVYMSGQNGTVIYPSATGNYSVSYSYGACSVSSASFPMNPSPVIAGIDKTNCVNNTTVLAVSNPVGGSSFTYGWAPNATIIGPVNNQQVSVQYGTAFDTISYSVTVTNNFTCNTKDSVYLITVDKPLLTLDNDTACQNDVKILVANPSNFGGTNPPVTNYNPTYIWTKDGVNLNNNNDTLYVMSTGKYQVQLIIGDCSNNVDSSNVLFSNLPVGSLPANSRFCDDLDSLTTLDAGAVIEPGKAYSYVWQYVDPSGSTSNVGTTSQIRAGKEGKYIVTITSKLGTLLCSAKDSVNLSNICAPRVFPPNVFTPEKDGKNSKFVIFGAHYRNMKVTVFNRWGEIIYVGKRDSDKDSYNLIEWDGTYKGEPMPTGVYPFIINYDGETDDYKGPYQIEGEVTILR